MTRQLEKTLNLPRMEDALREFTENAPDFQKLNDTADQLLALDTNEQRSEEGTELHSKEMDTVYNQAIKAHRDLFDLGFNIESRHAGTIFEPAARFLEIAMNASKSKSDQKLKALKMRIDREKFDFEVKQELESNTIEAVDTTGFIADRNELLKDLVGKLRDSRVPKK